MQKEGEQAKGLMQTSCLYLFAVYDSDLASLNIPLKGIYKFCLIFFHFRF